MEQNWKARSTRTKKRTDHTPGDFTALLRSADVLIHVLLSSVLSGAVVLGQYAPFGALKAEEERMYLERCAQGDLEARNVLVEHNLRLVAHIVKKYYAQTGDQDDLISIGTSLFFAKLFSPSLFRPVFSAFWDTMGKLSPLGRLDKGGLRSMEQMEQNWKARSTRTKKRTDVIARNLSGFERPVFHPAPVRRRVLPPAPAPGGHSYPP